VAGWVRVVEFGRVVGGRGGGAAPPPRPASVPAGPVRPAKPGSSASAVVIVVMVIFVSIAALGILAAIALPAYQDYTIRARISEGAALAAGLKLQVAEYSEAQQRCPHNGDPGFNPATEYKSRYVASATIGSDRATGECVIELVYTNAAAIEGKRLRYILAHDGNWRVSTDIPAKFLPSSMRSAM
jgi:type IV pilus assembly protein PilA